MSLKIDRFMNTGGIKKVEFETTSVGQFRWRLLPKMADRLLGPDGLRLDQWLQAGLAQVVKQGPKRITYRVTLGGLSFYLKHSLPARGFARLTQLLGRNRVRREFERIRAVAGRGLPTVEPLALGEDPATGESYLVTRALVGAQTLNAILAITLTEVERPRRDRLRQQLARELAQLVARAHETGVLHRDLHAANLLVTLEEPDGLKLHLIDLDAVELHHGLTWRQTRQNLIILNRWFMIRASRSDRLRFWRAYCAIRGIDRPECRRLARELERRSWLSNLGFWKGRDPRCRKNNRYYRRLRAGGVSGYALTDVDRGDLQALLADPDAVFQRPGVRLLKDSRSSTVAELVLKVNGVSRRVIYKRFRVTAWSDAWLNLLRRSPAVRSWVQGHGFWERCLPTPRPLAVFHRCRWGLQREGYLLTEKIEDAQDLHQFLSALSNRSADEARRSLRRRISQVALLIRELHRRRLSHRDLKAANVLIGPETPEGAPPFRPLDADLSQSLSSHLPLPAAPVWLIDLVGVCAFRRLPRRRRQQNMARLNASFHESPALTRTDRLRFLRVYLQWGLRGKEGWKDWWRAVDDLTRVKIERNRRVGRSLA